VSSSSSSLTSPESESHYDDQGRSGRSGAGRGGSLLIDLPLIWFDLKIYRLGGLGLARWLLGASWSARSLRCVARAARRPLLVELLCCENAVRMEAQAGMAVEGQEPSAFTCVATLAGAPHAAQARTAALEEMRCKPPGRGADTPSFATHRRTHGSSMAG
jgi:hypothetical protein